MTALSGPERKQAMDAITKAINEYLKEQEPKYADSFYRPDLVLVKGTKDWDLKGTSQALVELEDGKEREFFLKGKMIAQGSDFGSYTLQVDEFKWKN